MLFVYIYETARRIYTRFGQANFFLPRPFGQKFGDVPRQILRQQGKRPAVPRSARSAADMDQRVAGHILIEQHLARGAFARDDMGGDVDAVILRRGDIRTSNNSTLRGCSA